MRVFLIVLILFIILVSGIAGYYFFRKKLPPLNTVAQVDLNKYAGTWYEIARLPNHFEKGCRCVQANYTIKNSYVGVQNVCIKDGKYNSIKGKAWPVEGSSQSKLRVQFFWPFKGNYWILYLDKNYQYALVGEPRRKYLWILARKRKVPESKVKELTLIAKQANFDIDKLIRTDQSSCA